ncbi:gamma-glutamyl-gamma-aminobutyrate hydrolase [Kordiimonas sediminis]|uniref:gamma-glutamyl-gamma-aminobutyrate hydrolase n=1 Tax=Kordiimonas sediminis TaxID=1735581 RepID=A0A919ATY8_9PROT|nr:gamma-glutamyl-gamma-aminobutyrate hydrolase family protein [Kordiimonas sediminis]GHF26157.1 gamma-glutamyl-gamma-aminobutyrate hydrolase [Kordiimonas sediminis]
MKPVVAIICDTTHSGPHMYHQVGDKYIVALRRCADVTPILIPALSTDPIGADDIMKIADGILYTGGYSNIQRSRYGDAEAPSGEHEDPLRDANTLSTLPDLLQSGFPMLGICRGLQEMNVALGGTLYPRVHEIDGRFDHREDKNAPVDVQYGPAHSVSVVKDGILGAIVGEEDFMVNTVHGQAIKDLAPGLQVEAFADDTTIEAVSCPEAPGFNLAVQWHPEWRAWENEQSSKIFRAFGDAVHAHNKAKSA